MKYVAQAMIALFFMMGLSHILHASENSPWGEANLLDIKYEPNKVVYDLKSGDKDYVSRVLSRAVHLQSNIYESDTFDSSIVMVIHGDAVPLFAIENLKKYQDLMNRAQSLTVGTSIEFRMCRVAAKQRNYEAKDIHGFVEMVPMADAEIVKLQHDNYAYMR